MSKYAKPKYTAQVWNRYQGEWRNVNQPITNDDEAREWFFGKPEFRRVILGNVIIHQPRD